MYDVNWKRCCVEAVFGQPGSGEGEFIDPSGIACDDNGNIFVGDSRNHRIQVNIDFSVKRDIDVVILITLWQYIFQPGY